MFKYTVVLVSVFATAFAAVALMKADAKPEKFKNVQGCYIKDMDKVVPFDGIPSNTSCVQYRCNGDYVQIESCGSVSGSPPCKVVTMKFMKDTLYPKCCPRIECP